MDIYVNNGNGNFMSLRTKKKLFPEQIQKFEVKTEVDFQNYTHDFESFGEEPRHWYNLDNQDILHDEVHYTIEDLIEYNDYYKNLQITQREAFDDDINPPKGLVELIKYMYHEDWNEEQPYWLDFWRIKIISITGYLEEE